MSIKRSIPPSKDKSIDFRKSIIFSPGLNSGLFINKSINKNQIQILKEKLSSLVVNGESPIERVYMRNEVMWGPYAYRAADIFLIPKYGYEISHRLVPAYTSTPGTFGDIKNGTHHIKGVFLAYGPEISNGKKLKNPVFTWDITPTILHMFNLPLPSYMDGCVLKEIFRKDSEPATRPVTYSRTSEREKIKAKIKKIGRSRGL